MFSAGTAGISTTASSSPSRIPASACARWIAEDVEYVSEGVEHDGRVQDRYSIRCAPHVIGVLLDSLTFIRGLIETEINSSNDNPLLDPATGDVLHGGNFYGGHPCMAMDMLKIAVANVADLIDRQMALICNPATNNGLPADLVARSGADHVSHHGFKAMQITASALAAEALKLTMPASVFSRSTESHNQDKVSMGTIAARDALRVLELTETVLAVVQLALCQAVDLRNREGMPHQEPSTARSNPQAGRRYRCGSTTGRRYLPRAGDVSEGRIADRQDRFIVGSAGRADFDGFAEKVDPRPADHSAVAI